MDVFLFVNGDHKLAVPDKKASSDPQGEVYCKWVEEKLKPGDTRCDAEGNQWKCHTNGQMAKTGKKCKE